MDFSSMAGAATSGGFGIIGSLVNYSLQKKLAAQQNQYNLDMWKLQAEYNSPQAQMQRFKEAGLNPNLVYGQGSNGNMSSPPQMVTPQAPELSKPMQELGKAFNIENLKTMIANRKKAEAEADNAKTDARRNSLMLFAQEAFGGKYAYDYVNGKYVERPKPADGSVQVIHPSAYWTNEMLAKDYRTAHLIPMREHLLTAQRNYLAPQTAMLLYERKYQPWSFWIGNASKGLQGLSSVLPIPHLSIGWKKQY